jgi:Lrp/AsnC family transcriptional regulator for asnA, asnC and gidA
MLQKSGRATNSSIAHQLGISEATVRKRIDRLVNEGVITLAAVVHPRRIGFDVVGLVAIKTEFGRYEAVAEEIATMDQVSYVGYSLGAHDLILQVNCRSVDELNDFVNVGLAHISGIRSTETTIIPRVIKSMHNWPPPPNIDDNVASANGSGS